MKAYSIVLLFVVAWLVSCGIGMSSSTATSASSASSSSGMITGAGGASSSSAAASVVASSSSSGGGSAGGPASSSAVASSSSSSSSSSGIADAGNDAAADASADASPDNCLRLMSDDSWCAQQFPYHWHSYMCPNGPPDSSGCVNAASKGGFTTEWCCTDGCATNPNACDNKHCEYAPDNCGEVVWCQSECLGPTPASCTQVSACTPCMANPSSNNLCASLGLPAHGYACQYGTPQSFCTVYNVVQGWNYACCP